MTPVAQRARRTEPTRLSHVLVGTSGFSYPAWRGTFYPEELSAREMLGLYARQLGTVQINYTFQRFPKPELLTGWGRQTPAGFRFALKAPQRITHQLRLRDAGEPVQRFCQLAATLGQKLGPLLFQLPPYLRFDVERLAAFLEQLPPGVSPAFEFRDASWFRDETYAVLSRHHAALCIADGEALTTPFVATAPFGYLRLRRADYADADLDAWAARVREARGWKRIYAYFKHEESGRGPALARGLLERLGG